MPHTSDNPLRDLILKDIAIHEQLTKINQKMLRRITILYVITSFAVLSVTGATLYLISRPISQTDKALKGANNLIKNIGVLRRFVTEDQEHIAKTTEQLFYLTKRADSILYLEKHKQK